MLVLHQQPVHMKKALTEKSGLFSWTDQTELSPAAETKKPATVEVAGFLTPCGDFGRTCRIRTCDQRIKSPLLYQLS
jgi:hypothetical protein